MIKPGVRRELVRQEPDGYSVDFRRVAAGGILLYAVALATIVGSAIFWGDVPVQPPCPLAGVPQPPNFLPVISACLGAEPQRYLWRAVLISTKAFITGFGTLGYYRVMMSCESSGPATSSPPRHGSGLGHWAARQVLSSPASRGRYRQVARAVVLGQVLENLGVLVLSVVANVEHYPYHEKGTILWFLGANLSAVTVTLVSGAHPRLSRSGALPWQRRLTAAHLLTSATLLVAWILSQTRCTPYAHSVFALGEYVMMGLNLAFLHVCSWNLDGARFHVRVPAAERHICDYSEA